MSKLNVVHREMEEGDIPLILDSWTRQVRDCAPLLKLTHPEFVSLHRPKIIDLITEHGVTVACSPNDNSIIYGYICYNDEFLHIVYVRSPYRQQGVATGLLPEGLKYLTHKTKASRYYLDRWDLKYYPYL